MSAQDSLDVRPDDKNHETTWNPPIPLDERAFNAKPMVGPLQVYVLLSYYMALLIGAIVLLVLLVYKESSIEPALLVFFGFVATGAMVGSILHQIRMLFRYYIKDNNFEPRWLAKYISAPFEAVGLALAILALLQAGGVMFGERASNWKRTRLSLFSDLER